MIKIKLIKANPLSLQPMIALHHGFFKSHGVEVDVELLETLKPFYIDDTTANVGDVTRIFEHIYNGRDMIITSDLTRTMKLILKDNYKEKEELVLGFSPNQSLGIYCEEFLESNNIKYVNIPATSIAQRRSQVMTNTLDGVCMIDPFLNEAINNGYKVAYEGKNHQYNYTCWAFKKEFVDNHKQDVLNFHKALNEAGQYFNSLGEQEKILLALKYLNIDESLYDYYKNFKFCIDSEYSREALETAYKWKVSKDNYLKDIDISNIILKWDKADEY